VSRCEGKDITYPAAGEYQYDFGNACHFGKYLETDRTIVRTDKLFDIMVKYVGEF
jgi:hypothetical protein